MLASGVPRRVEKHILPVVAFVSPLGTLVAPQLTGAFFVVLALSVLSTVFRSAKAWREVVRPNATLVAFLIITAYAALSTAWAADPSAAFTKSLLLLGVVLVSVAAGNALPLLDEQQLSRAAVGFAAGTLLGALFLAFELFTYGLITRAALNSISLLHPPKRAATMDGLVTSINRGAFRQNAGLLILYFWPALLALTVVANRVRRMVCVALLIVTAAVAAFFSERMSVQLGLLTSMLTFPLAMKWRESVVRVLAGAWCLAFAVVLPVSFSFYNAQLHMAPWLADSARARVIIWEYTAERVLEHPWIGIGADSTRALTEPHGQAEQPEGFIYPRKTGPHAHNLFLQTWYELGLFGAILFAIAGVALLLRVPLLPYEAQPYATATFASFATMVGLAWSMWQTWLVCAAALTFLYLRIAAAAVGEKRL